MRKDIHPNYVMSTVTCSCGETFVTRSTKPVLKVELCSKCHPFYSGKQKLVDSGGRVQRFQRKYGLQSETPTTESAEKESEEQEEGQREKQSQIEESSEQSSGEGDVG